MIEPFKTCRHQWQVERKTSPRASRLPVRHRADDLFQLKRKKKEKEKERENITKLPS